VKAFLKTNYGQNFGSSTFELWVQVLGSFKDGCKASVRWASEDEKGHRNGCHLMNTCIMYVNMFLSYGSMGGNPRFFLKDYDIVAPL
jgi:hypothetical protein